MIENLEPALRGVIHQEERYPIVVGESLSGHHGIEDTVILRLAEGCHIEPV